MRVIEQRGLWFEEFEPETIYRHAPGRTFGEADNTLFSTLTMNPQALHLDADWSSQQQFGSRLINSMMTLATVIGLSVDQLTQGTIVANLGFSEVRFPAPMYPGDTLYAETRLLAKRLSSSRPGEGVVTLEHTGRNQHEVVTVVAVRAVMMRCRAGSQPSPEPSQELDDAAGHAPGEEPDSR
jgi:acyl dehydratase